MASRRSRRHPAFAPSGPTAAEPSSSADTVPVDPLAARAAADGALASEAPPDEPVPVERVQRWRFEKVVLPERLPPLLITVPKKRLPGKDPREGQRMLLQWLQAATGNRRAFRIRAYGSSLEVGVMRAPEPGKEPVLVEDAEGLALVERALKALDEKEAPPPFQHPPPPRMRRIDREGNPIEEPMPEASPEAADDSAAGGPAAPPTAPSPTPSSTEGEPGEPGDAHSDRS